MKHEIRSSSDVTVAGRTVAGYAAVFNSPTNICDCWIETIMPGAFRDSLASGQDVLALYSHELERLLGRQSAGTLRLSEDSKGLRVEIDLPDTTDGRDVEALITRGDLKGMSFGFCVTKQTWDETADPTTRTIEAVDLREVTITADPAYEDTEIGMMELQSRRDKRKLNEAHAVSRIAERKARQENAFRGIRL